jgi:threonine/homoserine/homoserine lactone efflux protein
VLVAALLGLAFGFVGSIPVAGPISALVLYRGLDRRYTSATFIGIGGALAEGVYAFLSFFGFSTFLGQHPWMDPVSRAVAAVMLTGLGVSFVRYKTKPPSAKTKDGDDSALHSFALGATITLLNPTLIATWSATAVTLFSTGLIEMAPRTALPFAGGAALGIGGWFSLFVLILKKYGERFRAATLERVVRAIGVALIGLAGWFVYRFALWLIG